MKKEKFEKIAAKIIWNSMLLITTVAVVMILACFVSMVEAMSIQKIQLAILASAIVWIAVFALFIRWSNK